MSIESQAIFYCRNVGDYNPKIKSDVFITECVAAGFHEFSNLLRTIYQDWKSYETSTVPSEKTKIGIMTDDLENYHHLTDTLDCLYAIATVGELQSDGEAKYLNLNKKAFKNVYKKSLTFPFEMLEKYSFYFRYLKQDHEISEFKRCDQFHVFYENGAFLIEAIKLLGARLSKQEKKKELPAKSAFMLADYEVILTEEINQNPTQTSIMNTLGPIGDLWKNLVAILQNTCGFIADLSFNPYVFPNRTITFKKNKKTICKFGINVDCLSVRFPLSYEVAKDLILKRQSLPQSINRNIDEFGCVYCGKCENSRNIEMFEDVPLCNLRYSNFVTEDSRCLRFVITNEDEVTVICDLAKQL